MGKFLRTICMIILFVFECMYFDFVHSNKLVEINTPNHMCTSDFEIQAPAGWGYRGFWGKSGLIGVLWPYDKAFKETNVAIFVFLENTEIISEEVKNLHLYTEKCPKSTFKFSNPEEDENKSLFNKYFDGRCGKTMILFSEKIEHMNLIVSISSSDYLTKQHLNAAKIVVEKYKKLLQEYIDVGKENIKYMNNSTEEKSDENDTKTEEETIHDIPQSSSKQKSLKKSNHVAAFR